MNTDWLDREKERLRRVVEGLDPSDLDSFFAAIAGVRASFAPPGDASVELNTALDSMIALRIQAQIDQLTEEARRDPLTGLGHRGAFQHRLEAEIERSRRYQRHFALVLFDLDHFKSVNDRFGHPAGDLTLISFATTLRSGLRQCDEAFRIGGDEFVAILPETTSSGGEAIGRRISNLFSENELCPGAETGRSITWGITWGVTWGVSSWPEDADPAVAAPETLLSAADRRLYAGKACKRAHDNPLSTSPGITDPDSD